jgi:sugar/nucleoside kinase (ribokinase family)
MSEQETRKTELLCIGNALVDVFAQADTAFMERYGITAPVQHIGQDEACAALGELKDRAVLCSGGGAANTAKIAAMLGMNAAFSGCTGGDALGGIFAQDLVEAGVDAILKKGREKTGVCLVLENQNAETRFAASLGAALEFTESDVSEELIANTEALVLDGFVLDRRPLVRRILQLANKHGIPVALDAASVFQIREKTEEILHYSRNYPLIVFMNADEAIVFYNTIKKTSCEEELRSEREKETFILQEICPVLKYITEGEIFPVIVIKLGGRGAVVLAGGNIYRKETFRVTPKNTVGAGDAFCAAFLSAWIRGKSISECAGLGNKVARKILEAPGTGIKREKFKSFARSFKKKQA